MKWPNYQEPIITTILLDVELVEEYSLIKNQWYEDLLFLLSTSNVQMRITSARDGRSMFRQETWAVQLMGKLRNPNVWKDQ